MKASVVRSALASALALSFFTTVAPARPSGRPDIKSIMSSADAKAWEKLPFTAREWARQTLLPYRDIPLKNGGTISVKAAYDLYLKAGQPEYPDMDTPGLVTPEEVANQVRISESRPKAK